MACFWREGVTPPPKRFLYRKDKLISIKMTSVVEIREMLKRSDSVMLVVSGKRRLLLDKDGSVARILSEIEAFRWKDLQEAAGLDSAWTHAHRIATGLEAVSTGIVPLRARGIAVLHLYRETLVLVRPVMQTEHRAIAEQVLRVVQKASEQLPFTEGEQQWLKNGMHM